MRLSIITVTYNNLAGLEKTYAGLVVFLRKHQDAEWIIIDGGSSDNTKAFLDSHTDEIAYCISEQDKGIYNAMNKGVQHANGEYLWFLNAGDIPTSEILSLHSLDFLSGEYLIYGDVVLDLDNRKEIHSYPDKLSVDYFIGNYLCHQAIFFKNIIGVNQMYDETFKIAADIALIVKWLFIEGRSYKHLRLPICIYNTQGVSAEKYYSITRPEIRRAVSQVLDGGESWYDAILLQKEWGDASGWQALLYMTRTQKLKHVIGKMLDMSVVWYERYISFKQSLKR